MIIALGYRTIFDWTWIEMRVPVEGNGSAVNNFAEEDRGRFWDCLHKVLAEVVSVQCLTI